MRRSGLVYPLLLVFLLWSRVLQADAVYEGIPNVSLSPDGNAFTTHPHDTTTEWYEEGYEVSTGIQSTIREPKAGEHLYDVVRSDVVPIGRWVVTYSQAKCVHSDYPAGSLFYGVTFGREWCWTPYYSGWFAYCADCGEKLVHRYFYMSDDTAKRITHMDMSKGYYYKCPHCDNLEQGFSPQTHSCKSVSANRYFVRYHANFGTGYMEKSVHMVNNSTIYEGQEVTPQTTLNLNTYTRKGYEFVGWNTEKDGSGKSYADGATIYNLSQVENESVILYAQWKKSKSTLEIDPAGGSYDGKQMVSRIEDEYGSGYRLDLEKLSAPKGATVHFNSGGGAAVESITGTQHFLEWSCSQPFYGELAQGQYYFWGTDGTVDRITAVYSPNPIVLPEATKEGYTFGGWFTDKECTQPVGMPGSNFIPQEDITLYAGWVELQLQAEDNYTANLGKGAVNLYWSQKDNQAKVYQLYQRTDASDWVQISSAQEKANMYKVSDSISFSGKSGIYTVPYTGFYTITLTGAQGGNYESFVGGKGGKVQGSFYLEKGDELSYVIGGQNGFSGGGAGNTYGNGGGYSRISSEEKGILLIAGGGGGASNMENGGAGGSSAHVIDGADGEGGETGGGGGYRGGAGGEVEVHHHADNCKHIHTGVPSAYGGCYTIKTTCENTDFTKTPVATSFYYGNIDENGNHIFCIRCGSDECVGHYDTYWVYLCNKCGTFYNYILSKCSAKTAYALGCGRDESYVCGMVEGEIIRIKPAYGGSNYINTVCCISYAEERGVQTGNGTLLIASEQIGLIDTNYLNGVEATDLDEPEEIASESIRKTAVGSNELRVYFEKPKDRGTDYYHLVKSFSKEGELLCTSNQTKNTLVSGVVGYRYTINSAENTIVDSSHSFYRESGEEPFLVVECEEEVKFLHVAAVDRAGNIGPTTHVVISDQDAVYWPLITEQLELEQGSNVCPAKEQNTYYVRANAGTPFCITLRGLLCGTARADYQINQADFQVQNLTVGAQSGKQSVLTPNKVPVATGTHTYPMQQLQKKQEGMLGLQDASYTVVKRYNNCKSLSVRQKYTLSAEHDGQKLQITPQVAAVGEKEAVYSDAGNDLQNSLFLIADGKGPIISGAEQLQDLELVEYSDGKNLQVDITASDSGSGLAKFYVEVMNYDNGSVARYEDTSLSGKIQLVISEETLVFNGEFTIGIYASDEVGNETVVNNKLLGVGLDAYVERVLEPHTPQLKRGESGVLYVETVGYIEKIEICFPEAFVKEDETLSQSIVYEVPDYQRGEEIPFVVPFSVPDGEMTIQVKAYKSGTELEATPEFVTIKVEGSILDELRTRLR